MNLKLLLFALCVSSFWAARKVPTETPPAEYITYIFKGKNYLLTEPNTFDTTRFSIHSRINDGRFDTLSNVFYEQKNYVEIIRQDFAIRPTVGVAMGFEFDETNGEYPYSPARAVIQLKDFRFGGVMFEKRDTLNYTGVSNDISDDLDIEIDGFEQDTIWGRFQGLLINGAGGMRDVTEGHFKIKLHRK